MRIPVTVAVKGGKPTRYQRELKNRAHANGVLVRLDAAHAILESRGKQSQELAGVEHVGPDAVAALLEVNTLADIVKMKQAVMDIAHGVVPRDVPPSRWPAKAAAMLKAVEMLLDRQVGRPIQRQQVAVVGKIIVERG